jgi:predicted site-specific integrase-resolvase
MENVTGQKAVDEQYSDGHGLPEDIERMFHASVEHSPIAINRKTKKENKMKCALYLRSATSGQNKDGIAEQKKAIKAWADVNGHQVVAKFSDCPASAGSLNRVGLTELLNAITSGDCSFECVVITDLSRLSRCLSLTSHLFDQFANAGIRLIAIFDGIDTADALIDPPLLLTKFTTSDIFLGKCKTRTKSSSGKSTDQRE